MQQWRLIRADDVFMWSLHLPSGWSAIVADWSQGKWPPSPHPEYISSASCRNRIITSPIQEKRFEDAKWRALNLALEQPLLCRHGWLRDSQACPLCLQEEGKTHA